MRILSVLFLALCVYSDPYPGIHTSISLGSLTTYTDEAIPDLISYVESTTIPPVSYWIHPLFIPVKLTLSNFVVHSLSIDASKTIISVNNATKQLYVTLSNVNLFLSAKYSYRLLIPAGGNLNLTLTNSTLIIPISVGVAPDNTLQITVSNMMGNTSTLDIEVAPVGIISDTFMIITKLWPLNRLTNHVLENLFATMSTLMNPYLSNYTESYAYQVQIGNLSISADYHFLSLNLQPLFIEAAVNGSFFLNNALAMVSPVTPPTYLPDFFSLSSVRIQLTEYFFDSLMWAMYQSNTLQYYVKSQNVPSNFPYTFTTSGLSKIAPGLVTTYGPNVPVDLQCFAYKIPVVNIQTKATIVTSVNCNFLVHVSPTLVVNAFTLITDFETMLTANLVQQGDSIYIVGSIDGTNTQFTNFYILNSQVGTVNTAKLGLAFNWYTCALVNQANSLLADQGILVPLPRGMQFNSPKFYIYQGAVEVGFEPVSA